MPINHFLESHDVLSKAYKVGDHFSRDEKRYKELHSYENNAPGGLAGIYITLDLNETRVSARHNLVCSILRLHRVLACFL